MPWILMSSDEMDNRKPIAVVDAPEDYSASEVSMHVRGLGHIWQYDWYLTQIPTLEDKRNAAD